MASKINGFTVGYTVAGAIVLWSGIAGQTISATVKNILAGKPPVPQGQTAPEAITGSGSTPLGPNGVLGSIPSPTASNRTAKYNQGVAKMLSQPLGWNTGRQWRALVALWNRESGWNNLIRNPSSGAFGIAQALGHGGSNTAQTVSTVYYPGGSTGSNVSVNEYPSAAANSGNVTAQIVWGLQYIQQRYQNPVNAWIHESMYGWY